MHLAELGIATLTSCFVNSNRDPKSEAAKPSDFFYFTPAEDEGMSISPDAANAFFALADAGKLPGWCVAIAPVDKLAKSRTSAPCTPVVWVGEGVVLLMPIVDVSASGSDAGASGLVRFPLGFVETSGEVETSGGVVKVPELGQVWVLDGEFALAL
ncbi:MAG TPA: hypothetical protein VE944_27520 [Nostoc sp.]|uniref:hypothetical protein n=1 Tax=Nostoc sp. TaxID=1180 RepID=UPI002D40EA00|nr:hypothetical protein [Nostoc sp.]HYX18046.1 hypothetical protein [Nostoc sp.]